MNFVMICGVPASGKSYLAEKVVETQKSLNNLDYIIFSSDKLREELFGDVNNQNNNAELFEELHKRIRKGLSNGENCIYDATNLNKARRIAFLKEIEDIPCHKTCYFISATYEKCVENDKKRDRQVGEEVIKKFFNNIEMPDYDEGWNIIVNKL